MEDLRFTYSKVKGRGGGKGERGKERKRERRGMEGKERGKGKGKRIIIIKKREQGGKRKTDRKVTEIGLKDLRLLYGKTLSYKVRNCKEKKRWRGETDGNEGGGRER